MENFNKVINMTEVSMDNARRFESLEEEMIDFQFQYIEKLDSGVLNPVGDDGQKMEFRDLLKKNTFVCSKLGKEFFDRAEVVGDEKFVYNQGFFEGSVAGRISEVYKNNKNHWKEEALKIINDSINGLGEKKRGYQKNEEKRSGLINFNLHKAEGLSEFGFGKNDDFISIHFKELHEQKNDNESIKNIFSGDSLSNLASSIVKDYPQVKAIVAKSWLIDSPIGKRIGFTVTKRYEKVTNNNGFWGQFISEKGELNKEKMKRFIETGKAEFYPAKGFIKTEDFLKKYLPKKERGIVNLKGKTKEAVKFEKEFNIITEKVKSNWINISFNEILEILNSNSDLSDYFKTKDGEDFLIMMRAFKDSGIKTMDDFVYDRKDDINHKFREFVTKKTNQYIDKEVFI